jgi:hypothetical protein
MTATSKTTRFFTQGDLFTQLSVILLTLIALAAGWWLKSSVENRSEAFRGGNITAQVPAGWLSFTPDGSEVLHITDRTTTGFGTTYLIEKRVVPADFELGQVVGMLTLERGKDLTGYRIMNQQEVLVKGRSAIQIDYVYVESAANLNNAVIPAVVHGLDYVFIIDGQAVIVSYRADQSVFELDQNRFYRFLNSVEF